uniref:6-hydroxymethyl-7,8-dihydropterin pyrophosphokinase n=1 Tax=uncultured marine thaumarchaeote KM3_31_D02 TaxID=1456117 RepID=A0A075H3K6_9ARCH|nr:MAF flag10 domain-containing protein [uncultured marine thaumarchaeote KM3_31_D02]
MTIKGWESKYREILKDFGYSRKKDAQSCKLLDSLLPKKIRIAEIKDLIEKKPVFVVGAGPSLPSSISILKKHKKITKIVADGATKAIIENGLKPDIVVTDLDGDIKSLKKAGRTNTIMVVHAHGDNSEKIHFVKNFKNCIGTTQTKPMGKVHNFGGFTDGDRCVFLANHFKAKKIILLGMDFGTRIGKYSKTRVISRTTKIKKLCRGKKLLEWLAKKSESKLYSTTKIRGFTKINFQDIDDIITGKNAF